MTRHLVVGLAALLFGCDGVHVGSTEAERGTYSLHFVGAPGKGRDYLLEFRKPGHKTKRVFVFRNTDRAVEVRPCPRALRRRSSSCAIVNVALEPLSDTE